MARRLDILLLATLAAALGAVSCTDCSEATGPAGPADAEARVESYAAALPEQTTAALVVGDLSALADGAAGVESQLASMLPVADGALADLKVLVGVDPFDEEAWSDAGFGPDAGFALALVDDHPVLLAHPTDRRAFERRLRRQAERHYGLSEKPRRTTSGGVGMKLLARSGAQIAWTFRGPMALVVFPPADISAKTPPTVTNTLHALPALSSEPALDERAPYRALRKRGDAPANFGYLHPGLVSRHIVASDRPGPAPLKRRLVQTLLAPLRAVSTSADVDGATIRTTAHLRGNATLREVVEAATLEASGEPWRGLADGELLAASRLSIDLEGLAEAVVGALPTDASRQIRRRADRWSDRHGLDLRDDVLARYDGDATLVVESVSRQFAPALASGRPLDALAELRGVAGVRFDSPEAAERLRDFLAEHTPGRRLLGAPLQYTVHGRRLLVATGEVDPARFARKTGAGPDAAAEPATPDAGDPPAESRTPRRGFLADPALAALHVDGRTVARRFHNRLPPAGLAARLLDDLGAADLRLTSHDGDLLVETALELAPE